MWTTIQTKHTWARNSSLYCLKMPPELSRNHLTPSHINTWSRPIKRHPFNATLHISLKQPTDHFYRSQHKPSAQRITQLWPMITTKNHASLTSRPNVGRQQTRLHNPLVATKPTCHAQRLWTYSRYCPTKPSIEATRHLSTPAFHRVIQLHLATTWRREIDCCHREASPELQNCKDNLGQPMVIWSYQNQLTTKL